LTHEKLKERVVDSLRPHTLGRRGSAYGVGAARGHGPRLKKAGSPVLPRERAGPWQQIRRLGLRVGAGGKKEEACERQASGGLGSVRLPLSRRVRKGRQGQGSARCRKMTGRGFEGDTSLAWGKKKGCIRGNVSAKEGGGGSGCC